MNLTSLLLAIIFFWLLDTFLLAHDHDHDESDHDHCHGHSDASPKMAANNPDGLELTEAKPEGANGVLPVANGNLVQVKTNKSLIAYVKGKQYSLERSTLTLQALKQLNCSHRL